MNNGKILPIEELNVIIRGNAIIRGCVSNSETMSERIASKLLEKNIEIPEDMIDRIALCPERSLSLAQDLLTNSKSVPDKILESIAGNIDTSYEYIYICNKGSFAINEKVLEGFIKKSEESDIYYTTIMFIQFRAKIPEILIDKILENSLLISKLSYYFARYKTPIPDKLQRFFPNMENSPSKL